MSLPTSGAGAFSAPALPLAESILVEHDRLLGRADRLGDAGERFGQGFLLPGRERFDRLDEPILRRVRRCSTRRVTTVETLLWWVWVSRARSFREMGDEASASLCSTKSCAPLIPNLSSAERAASRRARTTRRSESSAF